LYLFQVSLSQTHRKIRAGLMGVAFGKFCRLLAFISFWLVYISGGFVIGVVGRLLSCGRCAGLFYLDDLESMDKVMPDRTLPTVADIWQRR
jgi:hypothetical protein